MEPYSRARQFFYVNYKEEQVIEAKWLKVKKMCFHPQIFFLKNDLIRITYFLSSWLSDIVQSMLVYTKTCV